MEVRIPMIGGKCGCVFCKSGGAPNNKAGWKAQKNKHGRSMGKFRAKKQK